MIAILRRQTLRRTLAVAAVGFGCNNALLRPFRPPRACSPLRPPRRLSPARGSSAPFFSRAPGKHRRCGGVVYLDGAPKEPGAATTAAVDVYHKEFSPFISVITTGGTVTFGNKDALTHHVFSLDIQKWDTGYLRKNDTARRTFDSPGAIALLSNIHREMLGYLLVVPSTYFGKLGTDGKYVIASVPPGTYRATAWAPGVLTTTQSVTVSPTGALTANFELRPAGTTN